MSNEWSTNIPPELIPGKAEFRFDPQQWGLSEEDRMSEHTLDDLAARLAALGYHNGDLVPHEGSMCVSRFVQDDDRERTMVISAYRPRENWPSGGIYLVEHDEATENSYRITATLTPNDIQALSLIRQWQASAEPAPPPAAPVVTMIATDERKALVDDVINVGWKITEFAAYGEYLAELGDALEALAKYDDRAALSGADLAPEGARDDE